MGGAPGALGAHAYADAAYFLEVTKNNSPLLDRLRRLYVEPPKEGNAPLANRFMYGTDWEMILTEGSVGRYLAEFAKLFDELEGGAAMRAQGVSGVSAKFFGLNAADWLGLRKGDATRKRLDSFYAAHGVSDPDWAVKLGKLP